MHVAHMHSWGGRKDNEEDTQMLKWSARVTSRWLKVVRVGCGVWKGQGQALLELVGRGQKGVECEVTGAEKCKGEMRAYVESSRRTVWMVVWSYRKGWAYFFDAKQWSRLYCNSQRRYKESGWSASVWRGHIRECSSRSMATNEVTWSTCTTALGCIYLFCSRVTPRNGKKSLGIKKQNATAI